MSASLLDEAIRGLTIKKQLAEPESILQQLVSRDKLGRTGWDLIVSQIENLELYYYYFSSFIFLDVPFKDTNVWIKLSHGIPQVMRVSFDKELISDMYSSDYNPLMCEVRCPVKHDQIWGNLSRLIVSYGESPQSCTWKNLKEVYLKHKKGE